jgi:protease I
MKKGEARMQRALIITALVVLVAGCKNKTSKAGPPTPPAEESAAPEEAEPEESAEAEPEPEPEEESSVSGKKVVMIIPCKDFRDEELAEPKKILEEAGVNVTVASTATSGCKGMLGAEVTPDMLVSDVVADEYDAAVFVGGSGSAELYGDETVLELAREADDEGLIIGAICLAPGILASAGILEDLEATSYDDERAKKAFEEGEATWTGDELTVDGVIVTANGPEAAGKFGEKLVEMLE